MKNLPQVVLALICYVGCSVGVGTQTSCLHDGTETETYTQIDACDCARAGFDYYVSAASGGPRPEEACTRATPAADFCCFYPENEPTAYDCRVAPASAAPGCVGTAFACNGRPDPNGYFSGRTCVKIGAAAGYDDARITETWCCR